MPRPSPSPFPTNRPNFFVEPSTTIESLRNSSTRCEPLASRCSSTPSKDPLVEKEEYHPKCALSSRHSGQALTVATAPSTNRLDELVRARRRRQDHGNPGCLRKTLIQFGPTCSLLVWKENYFGLARCIDRLVTPVPDFKSLARFVLSISAIDKPSHFLEISCRDSGSLLGKTRYGIAILRKRLDERTFDTLVRQGLTQTREEPGRLLRQAVLFLQNSGGYWQVVAGHNHLFILRKQVECLLQDGIDLACIGGRV